MMEECSVTGISFGAGRHNAESSSDTCLAKLRSSLEVERRLHNQPGKGLPLSNAAEILNFENHIFIGCE